MADVKISALPAASALDGTEEFPVVQSATTKKATGSQMATYVESLFPSLVGTPAAGDISYWTGAAAQALLHPTSTSLVLTNNASAPTFYAGSTITAGQFATAISAAGAVTGSALTAKNAQTNTYQVLAGDFTSYKTITVASGTFTITLVANTSQPANGTYIRVVNYGSGVVTIARSGQNINGGTTSLTLPAGSATAPTSATIMSDGTDYFASTSNPAGTVPVASGGTGGTSVQTATQALSTPRIIYKQGLPMVYSGTGTSTGGGAITLGTALTGVQPGRALVHFPANTVVSGGSAAGWYFCTFSNTTTGQIIDITPYTPSSTPPVWPASPTAPTTATNWTGETGGVTAITFSVPANAIGANGIFDIPQFQTNQTNNANAKSMTIAFGSLASAAATLASAASSINYASVANAGTGNNYLRYAIGNPSVSTGTYVNGTVDTTAAVTVTITLTKGTATDNVGIGPFFSQVISDGT